MKRQILSIQGGGDGAYKADQGLVAYLRSPLGSAYELRYPKMPRESDPGYEQWKAQIRKGSWRHFVTGQLRCARRLFASRERPVFQAVFETTVSDCINRPQFQGTGGTCRQQDGF